MANYLPQIVTTQLRFLGFRRVTPDLKNHFHAYLLFVLAVSWVVGVGRYWDHPNAGWWQYAGLGSVAYVFVLSSLLYVLVLPLRPKNWSFGAVLVFVGLTALPGILYAIPVERFMSLDAAKSANALFLGIVALWRVALYARFLWTVAGLNFFKLLVAVVLPLSGIVVALSLLNLEHVVFDLMAGIREENASQNDLAYIVVIQLSVIAFFAFPVTLLCYVAAVFIRTKQEQPRT